MGDIAELMYDEMVSQVCDDAYGIMGGFNGVADLTPPLEMIRRRVVSGRFEPVRGFYSAISGHEKTIKSNPARKGITPSTMSDLMMSNESKREFDIHPDGTFLAVCRDIYVERKPNPKYPGTNGYGRPEPEVLVKVVLEYLTDEPIEIGGNMMPRFIRAKYNMSWNEKSALRGFVTMWNPKLGKADKADLEALVGQGAYLTVAHNPGNDGKTYANIVGIAPPPKGATIPLIHADFVRNNGKAVNAQAAPAKVAPVAPSAQVPDGDGDMMPF